MLRRTMIAVVLGTMAVSSARAADWPAYHRDAQRSGYTGEAVAGELKLAWSFKLPHAPTPAWSRNGRIRYDDVFQPVAAGNTVYFGDHAEGIVRALDLTTGKVKWRFQTNGPIRCAPTIWKNTLLVGSDDGRLYSLNAANGTVRWSIRPGPSNDLVLGNGYMISKWPVRGAPTVEGDTVYVGAGVWPSDGFYLLAIDADSGKVKWRNDDSGSLSMRQPHGATSKSGPAAQGYLTLSENNILVPPGRALPAVFDKATGRFRHISFNEKIGGGVSMSHKDVYTCAGGIWRIKDSRKVQSYLPMKRTSEWPLIEALPRDAMTPTGLVAAREQVVESYTWAAKQYVRKRRGEVISTENYTGLKSDWGAQASGPVGELIVTGGHIILGLDGAIEMIDRKTRKKIPVANKLNGVVGGLAFASGHLIASTTTGRIYCFSATGANSASPANSPAPARPAVEVKVINAAKRIVKTAGTSGGYALDLGCGDGALSIALTQSSDLQVIAIESDKALFAKARSRFQRAGLYGTRIMIFNRPLAKTALPNMFANLIVSGRSVLEGSVLTEAKRLQRPYGGAVCTSMGDKVAIARRGAIKGAGRWTHQYADPANTLCSNDSTLTGKLTMLWYRDYSIPSASRWSRAPAPLADNGILYQACPNGVIAVDAYNGREIWQFECKDLLTSRSGYYIVRTGGIYCLGDGVLYVRTNAKCLCLDAQTGKLLKTLSLPDAKEHDFWGYLAYSDGVIYGTAANTNHNTVNQYRTNRPGAVTEGKTLFAIDPKTARVLWRYEPKQYIGNNAVAIDDKNIYLIDRTSLWTHQKRKREANPTTPILSGTLASLNKKTGDVRWTNDKGVFGSAAVVSGPQRRVCVWHEDKLMGFDADSGKNAYAVQSWYGENSYQVKPPIIIGETIYWEKYAFDVQTGKKRAYEFQRSYGCGSVSASQSMLFFRSGTIGYANLDAPRASRGRITTKEIHNFGGIRPGCYINIVPAGGIVLIPDSSSSCSCSYFNQCWVALQPAGK
jgi:outer membrane protein assembly factor BamB